MSESQPTLPKHWKRTFFTIWGSQAFSLLGSMLVQFSLVWYLTQKTQSAGVLVSASLAAMIPGIFLGPFVGALVDRWNRRLVMILADSLIALAIIGLGVLFWLGVVQPWHIYVIMFLRSIAGSFHFNSMQASTSLLVPHEQLSRVAGLNTTLQGTLNIAAPPLGALLMGLIPLYGILAIDVVTAAIAVAPLLFIRIPQPVKAAGQKPATPANLLGDVRDAFLYLRGWKGIFSVLGMAILINFLLNPVGTLTPLLVTKDFGGGVWHLGIMESGWGLGYLGGGLLLATWGGFRRKIITSMLGIFLIGAGVLATGFAPAAWFWLAVTGTVISGLSNPLANGPLFAMLQSKVAPEMQGRVFSMIGSLAGLAAPLGTALAAPVADLLGVRVWFIAGGIACLAMSAVGLLTPSIVNLESASPKPIGAPVPIVAD